MVRESTKKKGDPFGVVESVKAASDVYMPVAGEVVEVNSELEDSPALVNENDWRRSGSSSAIAILCKSRFVTSVGTRQ